MPDFVVPMLVLLLGASVLYAYPIFTYPFGYSESFLLNHNSWWGKISPRGMPLGRWAGTLIALFLKIGFLLGFGGIFVAQGPGDSLIWGVSFLALFSIFIYAFLGIEDGLSLWRGYRHMSRIFQYEQMTVPYRFIWLRVFGLTAQVTTLVVWFAWIAG